MTTPAKRIGRPPIAAAKRRRNRVVLSLSDREVGALRSLADRGEALGTAARRVLLDALGKRR